MTKKKIIDFSQNNGQDSSSEYIQLFLSHHQAGGRIKKDFIRLKGAYISPETLKRLQFLTFVSAAISLNNEKLSIGNFIENIINDHFNKYQSTIEKLLHKQLNGM